MKSTKSICLLSCQHSIKDSHTRHFMGVLVRNGHKVLSIRPGSLDAELLTQKIVHCELPEVDYHFWPEGTPLVEIFKALAQRARNCWKAARALVKHRPGVVMCLEPDSWLLAVLLKPFLGHKVLADLRELYEDRLLAFPHWLQPMLRPLFRGIMWLVSLCTDEIMHVSEERRQEYRWLSKPGVVVVYYPDPVVFADSHVKAPSLPPGCIALHAGPLRNSYAANELLKAIRLARVTVPELHLVVLGGKLQALNEEQLLAELVAEGAVLLKGNVTPSEVGRYMAAADIGINLVLPVDRTHILAQPRKLYEYLLAGLPVIGSNVPTIKRVIEESNCGIAVNPESPEDIAAALVLLATDKHKRTEYGRNAQEAAHSRYTWAAQERVFLGIFARFASVDAGRQTLGT